MFSNTNIFYDLGYFYKPGKKHTHLWCSIIFIMFFWLDTRLIGLIPRLSKKLQQLSDHAIKD